MSGDGTVPFMASRAPRLTARLTGLASRLLSSLGLALVLVAQLSSLFHMGAIRHERCAEHGELVEVHGAALRHGASPAADVIAHVAADEDVVDTLRAAAAAPGDEHDHCELALTPAVPGAALRLFHVDLPRVLEDGPVVALVAPALAADRLDVAPKTSPPARA